MLIAGFIALLGMCFCLYNYWFQKERYKRMVNEELKRQNKANSPAVWLTLSILLFAAVLAIISFYIYKYYQAVMSLS